MQKRSRTWLRRWRQSNEEHGRRNNSLQLSFFLIIDDPPRRLHRLIPKAISRPPLLMLMKYFIDCDSQFLNLGRE
jgi:hypothetical protein